MVLTKINIMVFFRFCLSVFLPISLISCQKDTASTSNPTTPLLDSFTVGITNGYGSGKYKVGDTVHIWNKELATNQLFDAWSGGDVALLNTNDWHAWFIMPNHNTSFTANEKTTAAFTLNFEQIRGRDRLKPVYSYFPTNNKGIVYMLHGSGGTAAALINSFEGGYILNELVGNGFAVVVTEAEEATTQVDLNGDGKLNWVTNSFDTLANIDLANIRIITDTFYNRGVAYRSSPRYSLGMSNGGFFSAVLSYAYKFKAAISYCAQSGNTIASISTIPMQYCMQRFDDADEVGSAGNAMALANSQTLAGRGICSKYFINEHSPLYPERFARRSDISINISNAIFNEIKGNGYLNGKNYFTASSVIYRSAVAASPASFRVFLSLTPQQELFILDELDCSAAEHQLYSDYTKLSLKFLNTQCQ